MKAKAFTLTNQDGIKVSLKDFKDQWLILYFYPRDMTSGCTVEANDFSKAIPKFKKLNATIIGISPDEEKKHIKFIEKENLKITLLSDTEKKILTKYEVWKEKSMYGRKYMGVERSTFIINPKGNIAFEWRKVKVTNHVAEVLTKLKELSSP